jgi:hypothetical protein
MATKHSENAKEGIACCPEESQASRKQAQKIREDFSAQERVRGFQEHRMQRKSELSDVTEHRRVMEEQGEKQSQKESHKPC